MQATVEAAEIIDLFKESPITGTQILEGIIAIAKKAGKSQEVVTPVPTVRYSGQESITEAGIATLRDGVKSRLPNEFPADVKEVHLFYGTNLHDYVALVPQDGKYALKRE
jgi:hypothetical protein